MYVLSANYRDRGNVNARWLMRNSGEAPEKATSPKTIIAQGVKIQDSDSYEAGFGCATVAVAEVVETRDILVERPEDGVQLYFDGSVFRVKNPNQGPHDTDYMVTQMQKLILNADGCIYAVL